MDIVSKNLISKLIAKHKIENIDDDFLNEITTYFIENLKNIVEMLILIINHRKISSNNWKYNRLINEQSSGVLILESDILLLLEIIKQKIQFKGNIPLAKFDFKNEIIINYKNIKSVFLPKEKFSEILNKTKRLISDDYNTIKFSVNSEIIIQHIIEKIIQEYIDLK